MTSDDGTNAWARIIGPCYTTMSLAMWPRRHEDVVLENESAMVTHRWRGSAGSVCACEVPRLMTKLGREILECSGFVLSVSRKSLVKGELQPLRSTISRSFSRLASAPAWGRTPPQAPPYRPELASDLCSCAIGC